MVSYYDYTAFVVQDGTQTMYSGAEINGDTVQPFEDAEDISCYDMAELPEIAEIMRDNLLAEFRPAEGISDDGYDSMNEGFANGSAYICQAEIDDTITSILIWKLA